MHIRIDSALLTDAPYTKATKASFLVDDPTQLDQFVLELQHGNAGAYLISGYRGSGKTSFIYRLQEKLNDFVFVELNIAKIITYPVLVKKLIRQLYLQYQTYCFDNNKTPEDFMPEFQLLYDRTFNDIVNTNLHSRKVERKLEHQWKLDVKQLVSLIGKLIGPALISLIVGIALYLKNFNWWITLPVIAVALVFGALSAWTITHTKTDTTTEGDDVTRKSLYDEEIAEHHLFGILQKMKDKGIKIVIVFDELDKLAEDKNVKDIINDVKPMLLSGYASFLVVAGQSLYYDLEKSAYLDDIVISTLFSRTIHVAFLKNSTLLKFCLNLMQHEPDKSDELAIDFFNSLILQSGRIPRKLVNLIRSHLNWQDAQGLIIVDETKREKLRWRSRVLQAAAAVVDSDLAPRARSIVQQDFFTAQVFIWLSKMISFDSVGFRASDVFDKSKYGDAYPATWLTELDIVWDALWNGLKKDGLLSISEREKPEEDVYSWIFTAPDETEVESVAPEAQTLPDRAALPEQTPRRETQTAENQSRFLGEFSELEKYLDKLYREVSPDAVQGITGFSQLAASLISQRVLAPDWLKNSAVANVIELRNKSASGSAIGADDMKQIKKASSSMTRIWADINEQYVVYVLNQIFAELRAKLTTQGGFNILGNTVQGNLALEIRTYRNQTLDPRMFAEAVDKYENFLTVSSKPLSYAMLIFQPEEHSGNADNLQLFSERIRNSKAIVPHTMKLKFINMNDVQTVRAQIQDTVQELIVPPAV